MDETSSKPARLVVRLGDGTEFAPGPGDPICAGPDELGRCPIELSGQARYCADAEWYWTQVPKAHRWRFEFLNGSALCPIAVLDPFHAFGGPPDPSA